MNGVRGWTEMRAGMSGVRHTLRNMNKTSAAAVAVVFAVVTAGVVIGTPAQASHPEDGTAPATISYKGKPLPAFEGKTVIALGAKKKAISKTRVKSLTNITCDPLPLNICGASARDGVYLPSGKLFLRSVTKTVSGKKITNIRAVTSVTFTPAATSETFETYHATWEDNAKPPPFPCGSLPYCAVIDGVETYTAPLGGTTLVPLTYRCAIDPWCAIEDGNEVTIQIVGVTDPAVAKAAFAAEATAKIKQEARRVALEVETDRCNTTPGCLDNLEYGYWNGDQTVKVWWDCPEDSARCVASFVRPSGSTPSLF